MEGVKRTKCAGLKRGRGGDSKGEGSLFGFEQMSRLFYEIRLTDRGRSIQYLWERKNKKLYFVQSMFKILCKYLSRYIK